MQQIDQLIFHALKSENNQIRNQAELSLVQLRNSNPTEFFLACAALLENTAKEQFLRHSSGVLLGRLAYAKNNMDAYFWDEVTPQAKNQIKGSLLNALMFPEVLLMRCGASILSQIAAIEIPRGEWLSIVDILAQNTLHEQVAVRNASITTLGYICEQLKELHITIEIRICQQILGAILLGAREKVNLEIVETSLTALRNSLCFLHGILANKQYCDPVFAIFLERMTQAQLLPTVYQSLYQFSKYCYNQLGDYFKEIIAFTYAHIQQRNQNAINALELWDSIGSEYLEKREEANLRIGDTGVIINNYLQVASDNILSQVLKCLLVLNNDDIHNSELREAASKTLGTFVECCDKTVVDRILEFVSHALLSENYGERQATALLFAAVCEYPDKDYVISAFQKGFDHLYRLIKDSVKLVVKNTLRGFIRVTETFSKVFLQRANIRQIVSDLLQLAFCNDEQTQVLSLLVLCNITDDQLKAYPQPIATDPSVLLTKIVKFYSSNLKLSSDSKEVNEKIIILIMNTIMNCNRKEIINDLIIFTVDQYHVIFKSNVADKQIVLESILTIIHTCVLALSKTIPTEAILKPLIEVLDAHLNAYGVQQEGINLIGALAGTYKRSFADRIDYYWKFVEQGLQLIDQKNTFKVALTCVADIARTNENRFVEKIMAVFQRLFNYIHGPLDRELKICILACFGDLTLSLKKHSESYVESIIEISNSCFEAVEKFSTIDSEKTYAQQLKETLIEMYHAVIFAINDQRNPNAKLAGHFPHVATFIVHTCDVSLRPTVDYLKNCIELIYDSALFYEGTECYKKQVKQIIDSPQLARMVESISKYRQTREDIRDLFTFIGSKNRNR